MKHLKQLRFIIWRFFFLRYRLPKISSQVMGELNQEYQEYRRTADTELSFAEWCGTQVEDTAE